MSNIETSIKEFQTRFDTEKDFCEELFKETTIKLLAAKYAYYILNNEYLKDLTYDTMEKRWVIMGRALGYLNEDEISPCIDFDYNHPLAKEAIDLAEILKYK